MLQQLLYFAEVTGAGVNVVLEAVTELGSKCVT